MVNLDYVILKNQMECTENYGKLDEKELETGLCSNIGRFGCDQYGNNKKQLLLDRIAKYNRYIINIIRKETRRGDGYYGPDGNMIIIDNYGDYIEMTYRCNQLEGLLINLEIGYDRVHDGKIIHYPSDFDEYGKRTKYILPNIYIDIIKTITSDTDINIFININKAVEKYYNNFIKYDILYNSGKLQEYIKLLEKNDEKDKKIEELNNDILSKNQQIESMNNDILSKNQLIESFSSFFSGKLQEYNKLLEKNDEKDKKIKELNNDILSKNQLIESMNNDILSKNQLIESMKINIIFYPGSSRSDDPV